MTELKVSQEKLLNQLLEVQRSLRLSEEGKESHQQSENISCLLTDIYNVLTAIGKQEMARQLHKVQTSLTLQQDVAHCKEKESRNLEGQLAQLKTSLQASQTKCRSLQVC